MPRTIFARKPENLTRLMLDLESLQRLFPKPEETDYYIAEEKELSQAEWIDLTNNLLKDRDWIAGFSNKEPARAGGVPCIRATCICATAPSSRIALIIDPEGSAYARYVAIETVRGFEIEDEPTGDEDWEDDEEDAPEIDESIVQDALMGMLYGDWNVEDTALEGCTVRSYEDAGVMTYNKGLVISLPDGSEFQLTIVQSC